MAIAARTLFIVRHAHRDKPHGQAFDNGLSKKGRKQAKKVADFLCDYLDEKEPILLSSPKLRCMETLEPLASKMGTEVQDAEELGEQREGESAEQFSARVADFLNRLTKDRSNFLLIICSHGDWIPAALQQLTGLPLELKKGGLAELSFKGKNPSLINLIQQLL